MALSNDGTLAYSEPASREIVWVDRQGEATPLLHPAEGGEPRLSPDGRRLAVRIDPDIYIYDLERGSRDRLTFERVNVAPVWSPDGKRIAFSSTDVPTAMYSKSAEGSGKRESLLRRDNLPWAYSWSPEGLLSFRETHPTTGYDIWVLPLAADDGPVPFLTSPFNEESSIFSPDGRWIAYISDESGRYEVYVRPYPGPGRRWTISTEGGEAPVWSGDGRELFFVRGQQLWAVTVETEPDFRAGTPRLLFEGPYDLSSLHPHYDVSPDGRFIMLKLEEKRSTFNIILNWLDELERLAPRNQ